MPEPRKLLDQVRDALRIKHYSYRTEQTYIDWIKRYIIFHKKRHPKEMGAPEIEAFLVYLAQERHVLPRQLTQCCAESGTERPALSLQKRLATRSRSASAG